VPLIAYIHTREPAQPDRRAWEPDWSVWGPALGAVGSAVAAGETSGAPKLGLVLLAFGLGCRTLDRALPYRQGLREHRQ
jgi:hypothetical protein